eukprot:4586512-Prymnesium_polylepis.1
MISLVVFSASSKIESVSSLRPAYSDVPLANRSSLYLASPCTWRALAARGGGEGGSGFRGGGFGAAPRALTPAPAPAAHRQQ